MRAPDAVSQKISNELQRLKSIKALSTRKQEVKHFVEMLDEVSERATHERVLTTNSRTGVEPQWTDVVDAVVSVVDQEQQKASIKITQTSVQLWQNLQTVVQWAERHGHFLSRSVPDLCSVLYFALKQKKTGLDLLGSQLCHILKHVLMEPRYRLYPERGFYREFFQAFSQAFLYRLDPTTHAVSPPALPIVTSCPILAVECLSLACLQYPYEMEAFLYAVVLPFYVSWCKAHIRKKERKDRGIALLLKTLNDVLERHVLSVLSAYENLLMHSLQFMVGLWRIKTPSVPLRVELVRFLDVALRVSDTVLLEGNVLQGGDEFFVLLHNAVLAHVERVGPELGKDQFSSTTSSDMPRDIHDLFSLAARLVVRVESSRLVRGMHKWNQEQDHQEEAGVGVKRERDDDGVKQESGVKRQKLPSGRCSPSPSPSSSSDVYVWDYVFRDSRAARRGLLETHWLQFLHVLLHVSRRSLPPALTSRLLHRLLAIIRRHKRPSVHQRKSMVASPETRQLRWALKVVATTVIRATCGQREEEVLNLLLHELTQSTVFIPEVCGTALETLMCIQRVGVTVKQRVKEDFGSLSAFSNTSCAAQSHPLECRSLIGFVAARSGLDAASALQWLLCFSTTTGSSNAGTVASATYTCFDHRVRSPVWLRSFSRTVAAAVLSVSHTLRRKSALCKLLELGVVDVPEKGNEVDELRWDELPSFWRDAQFRDILRGEARGTVEDAEQETVASENVKRSLRSVIGTLLNNQVETVCKRQKQDMSAVGYSSLRFMHSMQQLLHCLTVAVELAMHWSFPLEHSSALSRSLSISRTVSSASSSAGGSAQSEPVAHFGDTASSIDNVVTAAARCIETVGHALVRKENTSFCCRWPGLFDVLLGVLQSGNDLFEHAFVADDSSKNKSFHALRDAVLSLPDGLLPMLASSVCTRASPRALPCSTEVLGNGNDECDWENMGLPEEETADTFGEQSSFRPPSWQCAGAPSMFLCTVARILAKLRVWDVLLLDEESVKKLQQGTMYQVKNLGHSRVEDVRLAFECLSLVLADNRTSDVLLKVLRKVSEVLTRQRRSKHNVDGREAVEGNSDLPPIMIQWLKKTMQAVDRAELVLSVEHEEEYSTLMTGFFDFFTADGTDGDQEAFPLSRYGRLLVVRCAVIANRWGTVDLSNVLLWYLQQPDFLLRLQCAQDLGRFMECVDDKGAVFGELLSLACASLMLPHAQRHTEVIFTYLLTLCNASVHDVAFERRTLLLLCRFSALRPELADMLHDVYKRFSLMLSSDDCRQGLIEHHMAYLAYYWIAWEHQEEPPADVSVHQTHQEPMQQAVDTDQERQARLDTQSFGRFPHAWVVDEMNYAAFVRRFQSHVVSALVMREQFGELDAICSILDVAHQEQLLRMHFAPVFCAMLPLYDEDYDRAEGVREWLIGVLGKEVFDTLYDRQKSFVLVDLVEHHVQWPALQLSDSLDKLSSSDASRFLVMPSGEPLQRALLHIRRRLMRSGRDHTSLRLFHLLRVLTTQLIKPEHLVVPCVFRDVITACCSLLGPGRVATHVRRLVQREIDDCASLKEVKEGEQAKQRFLQSDEAMDCVLLVSHLCHRALSEGENGVRVLCRHLRMVVSSLVRFANEYYAVELDWQDEGFSKSHFSYARVKEQRKSAHGQVKKVVDILLDLLRRDGMLEHVSSLHPFPFLPGFQALRELWTEARGKLTMEEELRWFLLTADDSKHQLQYHVSVLEYLQRLLSDRAAEVHALVAAQQSHRGNRVGGQYDPRLLNGATLVAAVIGVLVRMCGTGESNAIGKAARAQELAALCLGEIGVMDPCVLDTKLLRAAQNVDVASVLVHGRDVSLLRSLHAVFGDTLCSPVLLGASAYCLRLLLSTTAGQAAMRRLERESRLEVECIQPFVELPSRELRELMGESQYDFLTFPLQPGAPGALCTRFENEHLVQEDKEREDVWSMEGVDFGEWVCSLTTFLVQDLCLDPVLRSVVRVTRRMPRFARVVFPFAVSDILYKFDDLDCQAAREAARSLSHSINNVLQQALRHATHDTRQVMRLVLDTLLFVRKEVSVAGMEGGRLWALKASQAKSKKSDQSRPRRSSRRTATAVEEEEEEDDTPLPQLTVHSSPLEFQNELDLLLVARAAQSCGNYHTSVLFLELWCEKHYPSLDLATVLKQRKPVGLLGVDRGASVDVEAAQLNRCHELLVQAYRNVWEPDGLCGVYREGEGGVLQDLVMLQHGHEWGEALQGFDTISSHGTDPSLVAGMATSLQRMGCANTLSALVQRTDVGAWDDGSDDVQRVRELQSEAAWRMCHWEQEEPGVRKRRTGFHASLQRALGALHQGDYQVLCGAVESGRETVLRTMRLSSVESVEKLFPELVHLHMLRDVEKSFHLLHGHASELVHLVDTFRQRGTDAFSVGHTFDMVEPLLAVHACILKVAEQPRHLVEHACAVSSLARRSKRTSVSVQLLRRAMSLCTSGALGSVVVVEAKVALQHAQYLFDKENVASAVERALAAYSHLSEYRKHVYQEQDQGRVLECDKLRAEARTLMGTWLADSRTEAPDKVISYFHKAQRVAEECSRLEHRSVPPSRSSRQAITNFFQSASTSSSSSSTTPAKSSPARISSHALLCRAQFNFAQFCDDMYSNMYARRHSPEWSSFCARLDRKEEHIMQLSDTVKQRKGRASKDTVELSGLLKRLKAEVKQDNAQRNELQRSYDSFLTNAVRGYACTLRSGDEFDTRVVYRMVSLWFSNTDNVDVSNMVKSLVASSPSTSPSAPDQDGLPPSTCPSHKFLPLVYQIASRLSVVPDAQQPVPLHERIFLQTVRHLVKRLAVDHPFHTLHQLFALKNVSKLHPRSRVKMGFETNQDRVSAACDILNGVAQHSTQHSRVVSAMELLIEAYIELALAPHSKNASSVKTSNYKLSRVEHLSSLPVTTLDVPVQRSARYFCEEAKKDMLFFENVSERITFSPSGVTRPLIVPVCATDGRRYKMLLKPVDDLRQDAVMQQVFGLVNQLLQSDGECRTRNLRMRTYNVVPLTPSVGLVEWVDNTEAMGEYLRDAHKRLRPRDWTSSKCRLAMKQVASDELAQQKKVYDNVCSKFRPVMHHFFLEKFVNPSDWFVKRLAYVRSVAVGSIVGFVTGLGDRHMQNMLLDVSTAELVHIDFGVAFDSGFMLKVPEIVPFRLTRDVVDGMGVCGTDGSFTRCCMEVMRVLRENSSMIVTIFEVFIHDPLYQWAVSLEKIHRVQKGNNESSSGGGLQARLQGRGQSRRRAGSSTIIEQEEEGGSRERKDGEGNKDAQRAIFGIRQKLAGSEGLYSQGRSHVHAHHLSVQGQVRRLIAAACDADRLCRMYHGWSAWM